MRKLSSIVAAAAATVLFIAPAAADDFGELLAGPWGRVDYNWQPYTGALSKNSCPAAGISRPTSVGLFGEGGSLWIEAPGDGSLIIHDGSGAPRVLTRVRRESAAAVVYRDAGVEKRLSLASADRLSELRLPEVAGVPDTKYVRCKKKKP
jgi:hypothetical protein